MRDCTLTGNALAGHFSSSDLVHWTEHPVAIISDHSYDAKCVDTGSVFQHPNGTVYAVFATINATR